MKRIEQELIIENLSDIQREYLSNDTLLFDIECTGLSPKKSAVYLIGCAYRNDDVIKFIQLFAETISEEYDVLMEFEDILKNFNTLISFNGTRFDQPFILERLSKQSEKSSLPLKKHIDLYLSTVKCKNILGLQNYKQKTIEEFLGLHREDKYNGGELIDVYFDYINTQSDEALKLLLLHNFEDVKGMLTVLDIMAYVSLLHAQFSDIRITSNDDKLRIYAKSSISLPVSINKTSENYLLICSDDNISCTFNLSENELSTYLKDYKNYVFLLDEQIVVPKQLAEHVDKDAKIPCTKDNCKITTKTRFITLPKSINLNNNVRVFKSDYLSKQLYLRPEDITHVVAVDIFRYIIKH